MTLNQLIEELKFYAEVMSAGDFPVKTFKELDEQFKCVFADTEVSISYDAKEIHLWPTTKEE